MGIHPTRPFTKIDRDRSLENCRQLNGGGWDETQKIEATRESLWGGYIDVNGRGQYHGSRNGGARGAQWYPNNSTHLQNGLMQQ